MPTNEHPRGGEGVFAITLRPNQFNQTDFDEVIERHSQFVRWLSGRACPVLTELSQHDLQCNVCFGRGEIYTHQRYKWIRAEQSPHGLEHPRTCEEGLVIPWQGPIFEVGRVIRFLSPEQGGYDEMNVLSHTESEIRIEPKDLAREQPRSWEVIFVDYSIDLYESVEQSFESDGSRVVYRLDLEVSPNEDSKIGTNYFEIKKTLVEITEVKTEAGDDIVLHSFLNQNIYLNNPLPSGTKFTVKAFVIMPQLFVIQPLTIKIADHYKWEFEEGDMHAVIPYAWDVGDDDIVIPLGGRNRRNEVLIRNGEVDFDVLPYFEIFELESLIIDASGKKYNLGVDYQLFDYNKVRWVGGDMPSDATKYSVSFHELPAFRVANAKPDIHVNENKRLPKNIHLKRLERFQRGGLNVELRNVERPVGDWAAKYGG